MTVISANVRNGKTKPVFRDPVCKEWYSESEKNCKVVVQARASDVAFYH